MAALLSRHGFDLRDLRTDHRRSASSVDESGGISAKARPMDSIASSVRRGLSAAPNFAFELAVRRTTDHDMAGLDLSRVLTIISGSERVRAATLRRFHERFARFNLSETQSGLHTVLPRQPSMS